MPHILVDLGQRYLVIKMKDIYASLSDRYKFVRSGLGRYNPRVVPTWVVAVKPDMVSNDSTQGGTCVDKSISYS